MTERYFNLRMGNWFHGLPCTHSSIVNLQRKLIFKFSIKTLYYCVECLWRIQHKYIIKFIHKNIWLLCLKLTYKIQEILSLSVDLFVNFECSLSINLVFLLLTLGRYVPVGERLKQQQLSKLFVMFWKNHKITVLFEYCNWQ